METDQRSKTVRPKPVTSFNATHQENASLTNGFVMAIVTVRTTRTKRGVKPSTLLPVAAVSLGAIKQKIVSTTDARVCDGDIDCTDGSDEQEYKNPATCESS